MKNIWYKITGSSLLVFITLIILSTLGSYRPLKLIYFCSFFNGCPASMGSTAISSLLILDYIITFLIVGIVITQGLFYLKIKLTNTDKLKDWSVRLSLSAIIISILTFLFIWISCLPQGGIHSDCFAWSWILGIFPIGFAGILYSISLVILLINWLKNLFS